MGGLGVKKVRNHWFKDLIKYEYYDSDNININNLPFVMMALVAAGTLNFKSKRKKNVLCSSINNLLMQITDSLTHQHGTVPLPGRDKKKYNLSVFAMHQVI